jgi:hypothetical protein
LVWTVRIDPSDRHTAISVFTILHRPADEDCGLQSAMLDRKLSIAGLPDDSTVRVGSNAAVQCRTPAAELSGDTCRGGHLD